MKLAESVKNFLWQHSQKQNFPNKEDKSIAAEINSLIETIFIKAYVMCHS